MSRVFVFPGQGSQRPGMGQELAETFSSAREVFQEIDEALGQNLSKLMREGPEDELTLTQNAQPALMASSMAVLLVLTTEGGKAVDQMCSMVAGHSLGEYSALVAAGALPLDVTARLLRLRGEAMQAAVPVGQGAMAAILGLEVDDVRAIAEEASATGVCSVANDNSPGQVVVSGALAAVERAAELAKEKGAKRAMMLPVSAPFHCSLMQAAADAMAAALETTTIQAPVVPIIANVTARPETTPESIRTLLVEQVTATVRWRESMAALRDSDINTVTELGTGKVLSGLVRRIDRDLQASSIETPADIESFLNTI
ncbi:MAG: ACP S-malonyltransferase [Alphaproteobacteria bacterium]|jgi:[acyl-carrier-protein] S-malonyltransferase|nr:ACP S-malonyltransferase [Rhodospirillaceae bacterium]MBT7615562.1 ACP S-malonyltransferase [Rhodospirillaceae bacterium]MBT7646927.1 ACP S-malonyltransferase [Rhodospirillaceae bacterium]MDG2481290.1 ACP S-malonyltransferase [Alphaproteobacteria bacterium]